MICFVEGRLEVKEPTRVVLNASGVGYEIFIPLSSYDRLPAPGEICRLHTHDHVREDARLLYGFSTAEEQALFELLLGVSGIGPRIALAALSGMSLREIVLAIVEGDIKRLSSISGVGKKTAERMCVELRDRIPKSEVLKARGTDAPEKTPHYRDAVLALVSLGYKLSDAQKRIDDILPSAAPEAPVEDLVRLALAG